MTLRRVQLLSGISSAGTKYTADQVLSQLFTPAARETYAFYQYDYSKRFVSDLSPLVSVNATPSIEHDTTRAVKRTLTFSVRGDAQINQLRDLIQPRYRLFMPDGGYMEWPLGLFTVVPPGLDIMPSQTWFQFQLPDVSQLLVDASFTSTYTAKVGSSYITTIRDIVSTAGLPTALPVQIVDPGTPIPATLTWEYGTSRLQAVNDLLDAISYFPIWADESGTLRSSLIPDWNKVTPTATFDATGPKSTIAVEMTESADISQAYNQVLVIGEDPRRNVVTGFYENDNPASQVSTVNWHPKLQVIRDSSVPDAPTALSKAKAAAQQAARVYTELQVNSLAWPVSQDSDVYEVLYQSRDTGRVVGAYVEVGWTVHAATGGYTQHRLTRIVPS